MTFSSSARFKADIHQRFLDQIRQHHLCPPDSSGLLAVSGGLDSMVLMHLFAQCRNELPLSKVRVVTLDHGFREESAKEVQWVCEQADLLGFQATSVRLDIEPSGGSLQSRAREARWEVLESLAEKQELEWIATGHHRDDQAETLLLRLLRGTTPEGLVGIRARHGLRIRPLLPFAREELQQFAQMEGIFWREDPSNQNPCYRRNELRQSWIPALKEAFQPQLSEHLASLAVELQEDEEVWKQCLEETLQPPMVHRETDHVVVALSLWQSLPRALQRRSLRALVQEVTGGQLQRTHLQALLEQAGESHGERLQQWPGGLWSHRSYQQLTLSRIPLETSTSEQWEFWCEEPGSFACPAGRLEVVPTSYWEFPAFQLSPWEVFWPAGGEELWPLGLRNRREGDRLATDEGTRSLKRWWIAEKVPRHLRGNWPLVEVGGVVRWVVGLRYQPLSHLRGHLRGWILRFHPSESLTKAVQGLG